MKYVFFIAAFFLQGCIVVEDYEPDHGYVYYNMCYAADPYHSLPEYCEELPFQDALCCTWHVGMDCYEEWCIWAYMCQWEYIDYDCSW